MIQRIQSVYFFVYSILLFGSYFMNFSFPENPLDLPFSEYLPCLLASFSILIIFLFKFRRMQIRFTQFIIALHLVVFGLYLFSIFQQNINIITQFSPLVVAFLGLIFLVLGLRGIRKDEALIKSLDRLR